MTRKASFSISEHNLKLVSSFSAFDINLFSIDVILHMLICSLYNVETRQSSFYNWFLANELQTKLLC